MPPSGFSQEAINGLLIFVKEIYFKTLDKYRDTKLNEGKILEESIVYLNDLVERSALVLGNAIPSEGIIGLQRFVSTNYRDLIGEIINGKKQEGEALQREIQNIESYLRKFKL